MVRMEYDRFDPSLQKDQIIIKRNRRTPIPWLCSYCNCLFITTIIAGLIMLLLFFIVESNGRSTLSSELRAEIHSYQDVVDQIASYVLNGKGRHQTYNKLAYVADRFGHRMSGSEALEDAIDYIIDDLKSAGLENVDGEQVVIPHWTRGIEYAHLTKPRSLKLPMLGLGSSVGTGGVPIRAEVIVVTNWDELEARSGEVSGKIVVFNQAYEGYGATVQYRTRGASMAARHGARAALIRSVTPFSVRSPHTGQQNYESGVKKIPAACITVEDAEMLYRMQQIGMPLEIELLMEAQKLPDVFSRNVVAEIRGAQFPEETVLFSGHIDSWDVGQGAMDDGGGAFISIEALSILHAMALRPRRTLRAVLWVAEEQGTIGSIQYFARHKDEVKNMTLVMESDIGTFTPDHFGFTGCPEAESIMREIISLLKLLNISSLTSGASVPDLGQWMNAGVPAANIGNSQNDRYFTFHHSEGDTMTVLDPHDLDLNTAAWASVAYIVADLQHKLPRDCQLI